MLPRLTAGLLGTALCSAALLAQTSTPQSSVTSAATTAPVAYVYIAAGNKVMAYTTSASGNLTPVSSTTTSGLIWHLSVTKKFLFGIDGGSNIYTFAILPGGGLAQLPVLSVDTYAPDTCFGSGVLQVDETGSNLYAEVGSCHNGSFVVSFKILPTGELVYLGRAFAESYSSSQLRITGENKYAVMTGCLATVTYPGNITSATTETTEYKRESNGYLTYIGTLHDVPEGSGYKTFCGETVGNDASNHLAFLYLRYQPPIGKGGFGEFYGGDSPIGIYTVDSDGKMTTTSNYGNMVSTGTYPVTVSISPSGAVLATAGDEGFQFFHFRGGNQPVKWTGLFSAGGRLMELGWDKADHFYAMTETSLIMYHVTSTSYKQEAGLPNAFTNGSAFIVLSLQ